MQTPSSIRPTLRAIVTLAAVLLSAATVPAQRPLEESLLLHVSDADTGLPLRNVVASVDPRPTVVLSSALNTAARAGMPPQTTPTPATGAGTASSPVPPPPAPISAPTGYLARTDANGLAEIPAAALSGPVSVRKTGYIAQALRAETRGVQEIRLVRGAALTVRIVDTTGRPAPDARVVLMCAPRYERSGTADDRGMVRLAGLPRGRCDVRTGPPQPPVPIGAQASDLRAVAETLLAIRSGPIAATIQLQAGDDATVTATLSASATESRAASARPAPSPPGTASVDGTVTGPDRRPAPDVRVRLFNRADRSQRYTTTDLDGRYAFQAVAPGDYVVDTACPCRGGAIPTNSPEGMPPLTLRADVRATRDFLLQRGGVLSGRVLDESGEPEEGVNIRLYRDDVAGATIPIAGTRTDDRGEYRIAALLPGVYRVSASIRRGSRTEEMLYTRSLSGSERGAVPLAPGAEVAGIDFNVAPARRPIAR